MNNLVFLSSMLLGVVFLTAPGHGADQALSTDKKTGLLMGEGWETARDFCAVCHGFKPVIESRLSRKRWEELILRKQFLPSILGRPGAM